MCVCPSQLIRVLGSFVAVLLLVGCTNIGLGGAPRTIQIGLVAPFEGTNRALGYEVLFAVKLALQERNMNGGLNGYLVELVALNDFNDPTEAQIQAQVLAVNPDILGVVGHLSSSATLASLPIYQQANLAVTVPWSIAAPEAGTDRTGIVSVAANTTETAAQLETIYQNMGFYNIRMVTEETIGDAVGDSQALQIVASDGVTAGEILLGVAETDFDVPVFGQVEAGSPQIIQVAGEAANGLIFVSPGPGFRDMTGAEAFIEAYQELAGFPPGPRAVLAYDATQVLLDAIEKAMLEQKHRPNRVEVSAGIHTVQRHGLSGEIVFDGQGQRIEAPVWVYQIVGANYPGSLLVP